MQVDMDTMPSPFLTLRLAAHACFALIDIMYSPGTPDEVVVNYIQGGVCIKETRQGQ